MKPYNAEPQKRFDSQNLCNCVLVFFEHFCWEAKQILNGSLTFLWMRLLSCKRLNNSNIYIFCGCSLVKCTGQRVAKGWSCDIRATDTWNKCCLSEMNVQTTMIYNGAMITKQNWRIGWISSQSVQTTLLWTHFCLHVNPYANRLCIMNGCILSHTKDCWKWHNVGMLTGMFLPLTTRVKDKVATQSISFPSQNRRNQPRNESSEMKHSKKNNLTTTSIHPGWGGEWNLEPKGMLYESTESLGFWEFGNSLCFFSLVGGKGCRETLPLSLCVCAFV